MREISRARDGGGEGGEETRPRERGTLRGGEGEAEPQRGISPVRFRAPLQGSSAPPITERQITLVYCFRFILSVFINALGSYRSRQRRSVLISGLGPRCGCRSAMEEMRSRRCRLESLDPSPPPRRLGWCVAAYHRRRHAIMIARRR